MKRKINKKYYLLIVVVLIFLMSVLILVPTIKKDNIKLTQLSPQGPNQMMGYILKTKNNKLIVIDGGTIDDTQNLMKYINENNNKVDYWFITHAHNDHAGAFTEIVNNTEVEIGKIYISLNDYEWYERNEPNREEFSKLLIDTVNSEKIKKVVESPKLNQLIQIDEIKVEILGIRNPEITENPGNEQSMVIKFDTGKTKLLILGDTGTKSSQKLLKNQKNKLKSDIVQMAHHGQAGATEELYKEIEPRVCLWPTPEWLWNNDSGAGINSGNWKTFETKKWMKQINVKRNYIAKDGDITINID